MRAHTLDLGTAPEPLKYVVIFARMENQWLFVRHKRRTTYETVGGHIERGETPLEAARRELYEEGGVTDSELYELFDYCAEDEEGHAYGRVFGSIGGMQGILPDYEMAEACLFGDVPIHTTYSVITNVLMDRVRREWSGAL